MYTFIMWLHYIFFSMYVGPLDALVLSLLNFYKKISHRLMFCWAGVMWSPWMSQPPARRPSICLTTFFFWRISLKPMWNFIYVAHIHYLRGVDICLLGVVIFDLLFGIVKIFQINKNRKWQFST